MSMVPKSVPDDPRVAPGLDLPRGSVVVYRGTSLQRGDGGPTDWAAPGATAEINEALSVTQTDAVNGQVEVLSVSHRATGSAAANDGPYISAKQDNSAGEETEIGRLGFWAHDVTDGSEDSTFSISTISAGTLTDLTSSASLVVRAASNTSNLYTLRPSGMHVRGSTFGNGVYLNAAGGGYLSTNAGAALTWSNTAQKLNFGLAKVALGGGAAATMGTIGGSGPTAAAQSGWMAIQIDGVDHWIPVWV